MSLSGGQWTTRLFVNRQETRLSQHIGGVCYGGFGATIWRAPKCEPALRYKDPWSWDIGGRSLPTADNIFVLYYTCTSLRTRTESTGNLVYCRLAAWTIYCKYDKGASKARFVKTGAENEAFTAIEKVHIKSSASVA